MTQEDKDILMEKMLDPDASLTDAELDIILHDAELREIYDISSAVKSACVQPSAVDVEQEWRLFRHRIQPKPSRWRWVMRVAAIFIGVVFVSGIVKVALDSILSEGDSAVVVDATPKKAPQSPAEEVEGANGVSGLANDAEASGGAVKAVPVRRRVPKAVQNEDTDQNVEEIDIDEYLRLEQARIDNDLALLQARTYIDEVQALREAELPDADPQSLDNDEIRYVIMQ